MSEQHSSSLDLEGLTPEDQLVHTKQSIAIEKLITDSPSIGVEDLPPSVLSRLEVHFIGGRHTPEFGEAFADRVIGLAPTHVIEESVGCTREERHNREIMENMLLRGISPIVRNSKGESFEVTKIGSGAWQMVAEGLAKEGQQPVIRMMDLAEEDNHKAGLAAQEAYQTAKILKDIRSHRNYPNLKDAISKLQAARQEDAEFTLQREQKMIEDISTISANALWRMPNQKVVIAVLHGAIHTSPYHYFKRLGVSTRREFIAETDLVVPEVFRFDNGHASKRQDIFSGEVGEFDAKRQILRQLIGRFAFIRMGIDAGALDEFITNDDIAAVTEVWEDRDQVLSNSGGIKTARANSRLNSALKQAAQQAVRRSKR